jgi:hypothetical protein
LNDDVRVMVHRFCNSGDLVNEFDGMHEIIEDEEF